MSTSTSTSTSTITVGGTGVAVDVTQLRAIASRLDSAISPLREAADRAPRAAIVDEPMLHTLVDSARRAAENGLAESEELVSVLRAAADDIEQREAFTAHVIESMLSQLVAASAFVAARLGVFLAPGLLRAAAVAASVWALMPEHWKDSARSVGDDAVDGLVPALSNPALLEAVRVALRYVDDAVLGAAGVPPHVVAALGDPGLGLVGLDSVAGGITALASIAGVAGIAPVIVRPVGADLRRGTGHTVVDAPVGVAERVARVPGAETPIVVERFERPDGSVWFEVYIAGTAGAAPLGGHQPWDTASNIANAAGLPSSSLQAVRAALLAAGAAPGSEVVFTGYSQGGAIAARLAESGEWHTLGLVTVGAPSGSTPVTGSYPAIVIEHRDDLVPTLDGPRAPSQAVVVVGEGVQGAHPEGTVLPAHEFERYESTAAEVDVSEHPAVVDAIAALPTTSQPGTSTAYTAERVTAK